MATRAPTAKKLVRSEVPSKASAQLGRTEPSASPAVSPRTKEDRRLRQGRKFLHQLTSGMAGWLTFEQMQLGLNNLREAELAKPLDRIARGRGYEIKGEFPLPRRDGKRGARPKVDFLLVCHKRRIAIAIETKYKKSGKRLAGSIGADASRLSALRIEALEDVILQGAAPAFSQPITGYALLRAVIVVWHRSDIMEQMRLEPVVIKKQFSYLVSALLPKDVKPNSRHFAEAMLGKLPTFPVGKRAGALRPGSTFTYKRFWVACFIERASWKALATS